MTAPQTQSAAPAAWTLTFDWNDNHCARDLDDALELVENVPEDLAAELKAKYATKDIDSVHWALLTDIKDLESDLDDLDEDSPEADTLTAKIDILNEVAARMTYCGDGCECSSDTWDCDKDYFNSELAALGSHVWAVSDNGYRETRKLDDVNDTIDLDRLISTDYLGSRAEWSNVKLEWTGSQLHVRFGGQCQGADLTFVPLTVEQESLWDRWGTLDCEYDDQAAHHILTHPLWAVEAAIDLWRDAELDAYFGNTVQQLIAAVATYTEDAWSDLDIDPDVFCELNDRWTGTLAELLTVASVIVTPALAQAS